MKLGKLLGAGKSFFGGQGVVTYRENKQVYLPKFNPGKNPFALKQAEAEAEAETPASEMAAVVEARQPKAPAPAPTAVMPARESNWTEKLNPFRNVKAAKSAPAVSMPNVQPEFSLGAVKVIHNDLSDAEVEVVPMKSRSATPAPTAPMEFLGEPVMKSI
jgi:hypothetical protein